MVIRYDDEGLVILRYDYRGVGDTLHATAHHNRNDCDFEYPSDYIAGRHDAHYPVPAIAYYYSWDSKYHDLQYVMLCSDDFTGAVIRCNL